MRRHPALRLAAIVLSAHLIGPSSVAAEGAGVVTASVTVSAISVSLKLTADSADAGQPVQAKVTVTNVGADAVRGVAVSLRFDAEGLRLFGPVVKTIGHLGGGKSASAAWSIRGRVPGSYLILAQATLDGVTVESDSAVLIIIT